jgi:hypothetical protein
MKFFLFSLACLCLLASCSRNQNQEDIPAGGALADSTGDQDKADTSTQTKKIDKEVLLEFIPKGYVAKDWATGDLNRDEEDDVVLVVEKEKAERSPDDGPDLNEDPRPVILLTRSKGGELKLAARNDNLVLCSGCGGVMGDPFTGISIKNGYFSLEHYGGSGWRWTRIITFKYAEQDKNWYLHKDGGDNYHASDPDKVETKVLTKKDFGTVKFEDYNYNSIEL